MAPRKSILLPLLTALPYASAWGSLGHTTVAFIAQNLVSSKTAQFAQGLLNDSSTAYLANVAIWADSYRYESAGKFSAAYHYIDALDNPPQSCNVNYERDCPEEGCIVSALANYTVRAVDTTIPLIEQQKALKWLVHFIGDIHQPLHVENLELGGNQINVTFNGVVTNLHAAWDTAIPQKLFGGNYSIANALSWATNLTAEIEKGKFKKESKTWTNGINIKYPINSTMLWASDANQYVCSTVIPNGPDAVRSKEISGAYYVTAAPVVQKQLAKAGVRLAAWLDDVAKQAGKTGHAYSSKVVDDKLENEAQTRQVKRDSELEPWMREAREKRRAFGGCDCHKEEHVH